MFSGEIPSRVRTRFELTGREYSKSVVSARGRKDSQIAARYLKDPFLAAQVAKGSDVGDGKRDTKLIFGAHLAQRDAPVFEGKPAAISVVCDLRDLVLQRAVLDVVAHATGEIKAFAIEASVAD